MTTSTLLHNARSADRGKHARSTCFPFRANQIDSSHAAGHAVRQGLSHRRAGQREDAAQMDPVPTGPYAALQHPNYRRFVFGWVISSTSLQMMAAAISWEVYARTSDELALGIVGLCQALPVLLFALPSGQLADSHDRKKIVILAQWATVLCTGALAVGAYLEAHIYVIYGLIVCVGSAKAFASPARGSMFPLIVPPEIFQNAVTWNSMFFHCAATSGPIIAGAVMAATGAAWPVFMLTAMGTAVFAVSVVGVKPRAQDRTVEHRDLRSMAAGAKYVWNEKTILGALTLDLMAVLFGGATALMPVFAKNILHCGEIGFGMLRAAPFVGAMLMAFHLAHRPPFKHAGRTLLISVAGFGFVTILFGLSTSFWLSLACLVAAGAVDNISVVIRHVLVQMRTPDALRGRVTAVNTVFIESSNELGSFESGLVASLFTPVISVVSGGIGTIVVVLFAAMRWPALRNLKTLRDDDQS